MLEFFCLGCDVRSWAYSVTVHPRDIYTRSTKQSSMQVFWRRVRLLRNAQFMLMKFIISQTREVQYMNVVYFSNPAVMKFRSHLLRTIWLLAKRGSGQCRLLQVSCKIQDF